MIDTSDQVIQLEPTCQFLMQYFIEYTNKRLAASQREDYEPLLTSNQVLSIIECLLGGWPLLDSQVESKPVIELDILVAILSSSQIPVRTSSHSKKHSRHSSPTKAPLVEEAASKSEISADDLSLLEQTNSNHQTMNNLINSFLNFSFDIHNSKQASSETPTESVVTVVPAIKRSNSTQFENYANKSPLAIFQLFSRKYFLLYNGAKTVLDEFESILTYLNVYRKNHLKQLVSLSDGSVKNVAEVLNLGNITYDEAMQSKAK